MTAVLVSPSLLGIWMVFKYSRDMRIMWLLLAVGVLLPVALLFV